MANKLAIIALAAAAVAAAPALARGRGGGRRPRPRQALRVCVDAAGENAFLEGCEVLSHQGLLVPQDVAIDTECVELADCLDLTQGSPRERRATSDAMIYCILRIEKRSLSAILRSFFTDTRAPAPARAKIPTQTGRRSCRGGAQGYPWGACAQGEAIIHSTVPHHSCTYSHLRIPMNVFPCTYSHVLPFPDISLLN